MKRSMLTVCFILSGCFADPGMTIVSGESEDSSSGSDSAQEAEASGSDSSSDDFGETGEEGETSGGQEESGDDESTGGDEDSSGGESTGTSSNEGTANIGDLCDPTDPEDPCRGNDQTCTLHVYNGAGYEFFCREYTGDVNGGEYGDPVTDNMSWDECKSGFRPLGAGSFPDGDCSGNFCCTPICNVDNQQCPGEMSCWLNLDMDPDTYNTEEYGFCTLPW